MNSIKDKRAGSFSAWLQNTEASFKGEIDANVPCEECVACCTSSMFVHIMPKDIETLNHIPRELVFAAPNLPKGHYLMGYDEKGHCPMFTKGKCTIYSHRPTTCRQYDCRVFSATGVEPEQEKSLIKKQVSRWYFALNSQQDRELQEAVKDATKFLQQYGSGLAHALRPVTATQKAILVMRIYHLFLAWQKNPQQQKIDQKLKEIESLISQQGFQPFRR